MEEPDTRIRSVRMFVSHQLSTAKSVSTPIGRVATAIRKYKCSARITTNYIEVAGSASNRRYKIHHQELGFLQFGRPPSATTSL